MNHIPPSSPINFARSGRQYTFIFIVLMVEDQFALLGKYLLKDSGIPRCCFFGEDDDDLNRETNSQKWLFGLVHTVVLSSMKGSGRLQAQPSESCKVKKVQGSGSNQPNPFCNKGWEMALWNQCHKLGDGLNAMKRAENLSWSTWQCHAAVARYGTVPHTEPKMSYKESKLLRYCMHSPLDLYCACQPGHRCHGGVQYLSL